MLQFNTLFGAVFMKNGLSCSAGRYTYTF